MLKVDGMILQHVEELLKYFQFGLWWVALGVASSIGLGKQYENYESLFLYKAF